jgi:DNA polymerase V
VTGNLLVFVQTNRFIEGEPQYAVSESAAFPIPTASTPEIIRLGHRILEKIFKPGFRYKKTGVMLFGIECAGNQRLRLLDSPAASPRGEALMRVMDRINARWGRDTVAMAACGIKREWRMKQGHRSPRYTTAWDELPMVLAG